MSSAGAGTGSLIRPPSLMAKQFAAVKAQPFFYIVGSLFIPLGLAILTFILICHSSLIAAIANVTYAYFHYLFYLVIYRHGPDHFNHPGNELMFNFHIPVLLALITCRALVLWTVSKKIPHTSEKKKRVVLGLGITSMLGVWIAFHTVASDAQAAIASSKNPDEISPNTLFIRLYYSTLVFTFLSLISPFWVPTSDEQLRQAEQHLLKVHKVTAPSRGKGSLAQELKSHFTAHHSYLLLESAIDRSDVGSGQLDENENASTSSTSQSSASSSSAPKVQAGTPLVFLHGYGAGKSFWFRNLSPISAALPDSPVYALDLLGMGCSAHQMSMDHCVTSTDAEHYFVDALEAWRRRVGLKEMILVGHSFGGYISACYALRYPNNVRHLILVSPVGLPEAPPFDPNAPTRGPAWLQRFGLIHILRWLWTKHITLSMGLHFLGPIGPMLFKRIVAGRFAHLNQTEDSGQGPAEAIDVGAIAAYCYHLNAGACPGHRGLNLLLKPGAYAIDPLLPRLSSLESSYGFGVSLLYGANDWMDAESGQKLSQTLLAAGSHAECLIVPRSGHQLYLENPTDFNSAIIRIVKQALLRPKKQVPIKPTTKPTTSLSSNGKPASVGGSSLHQRNPTNKTATN